VPRKTTALPKSLWDKLCQNHLILPRPKTCKNASPF
jgi:hypothetical protein